MNGARTNWLFSCNITCGHNNSLIILTLAFHKWFTLLCTAKESSEDKSSKKPTTQDAMAAMFQPTTDGSSVTNLKPTTTVLVFTTFIISILK